MVQLTSLLRSTAAIQTIGRGTGCCWGSAVISPVPMVGIYFGILPMPPHKRSGPAPIFAGFLYLGAGLAAIFAGLRQGQRLD